MGPNPTANFDTRILCILAAVKCPSSCTAITAASAPSACSTDSGPERSIPAAAARTCLRPASLHLLERRSRIPRAARAFFGAFGGAAAPRAARIVDVDTAKWSSEFVGASSLPAFPLHRPSDAYPYVIDPYPPFGSGSISDGDPAAHPMDREGTVGEGFPIETVGRTRIREPRASRVNDENDRAWSSDPSVGYEDGKGNESQRREKDTSVLGGGYGALARDVERQPRRDGTMEAWEASSIVRWWILRRERIGKFPSTLRERRRYTWKQPTKVVETQHKHERIREIRRRRRRRMEQTRGTGPKERTHRTRNALPLHGLGSRRRQRHHKKSLSPAEQIVSSRHGEKQRRRRQPDVPEASRSVQRPFLAAIQEHLRLEGVLGRSARRSRLHRQAVQHSTCLQSTWISIIKSVHKRRDPTATGARSRGVGAFCGPGFRSPAFRCFRRGRVAPHDCHSSAERKDGQHVEETNLRKYIGLGACIFFSVPVTVLE
eukprot:scaffold310_cov335-Pavlova_lutheri.AAC.61